MFKSRSFWSGIGFGLIIGTLLLQIMYTGSATESDQFTSPSIEEIQDMAEEAGYVLLESDVQWYSTADVDHAIASAVEDAIAEQEEQEPEVTAYAFLIMPGMTSEQVTDMLLQLSLIRDRARFLEMLTERSLHDRIRAGLYVIEEQTDAEAIITEMTR